MRMRTLGTAAGLLLPIVAACSGRAATPGPVSDAGTGQGAVQGAVQAVVTDVLTATVAPTIVARLTPPPTSTVDAALRPMAAVPVEGMPDIVVPAAARRVRLDPGSGTEDWAADFVAPSARQELSDWFEENLGANGWAFDGEKDGALMFEHKDQLSARFAGEGMKRSATVFFDTVDDVGTGETGFTIIAEAPLAGSGGN